MKPLRRINRLLLVFGIISTAFFGLRCKEEPTEVVAGVATIASIASDSAAAHGRHFLAWILEPQQEPVAYLLIILLILVLLNNSLKSKTDPHRP